MSPTLLWGVAAGLGCSGATTQDSDNAPAVPSDRALVDLVVISLDTLRRDRIGWFGGGDTIAGNLLLNTCRESSDHGPWNSWDRVPYITTLRTGSPSVIPKERVIRNNFVIGTYNSPSIFCRTLFQIERAALHSYGPDPHSC